MSINNLTLLLSGNETLIFWAKLSVNLLFYVAAFISPLESVGCDLRSLRDNWSNPGDFFIDKQTVHPL